MYASLFSHKKIDVLKSVAKLLEESCGIRTVENSVVNGKGKSHCGINYVLTVNLLDALGYTVYAKYSGLGRIDDRSKGFDSERAEV